MKMRQERREVEPRIKHSKFSLKLSSTVLRDLPPYLTMVSWMIIVETTMIKNNLLLKKFSKTLTSSGFNFLALISLKTWRSTKTLKKME